MRYIKIRDHRINLDRVMYYIVKEASYIKIIFTDGDWLQICRASEVEIEKLDQAANLG